MTASPAPGLGEQAWRLIVDEPRTGAANMALDEALLSAQIEGELPPTLRLYAWQPPCMSLGYFQRAAAEVDLAACAAAGVDVVRRPTGGRAVLHEHELTYSIVIRQELLPGGVLETYQVLSQGILTGLECLGIHGEQARPRAREVAAGAPRAAEDGTHAACFDAPSWYETVVHGRKIVGSAQTRRDGVILQHGSLLLSFDAARLAALLRVRHEERRLALQEDLVARVTSASEVLGRPVGFAEAAEAVACGMRRALGVVLASAGYTPAERVTARELEQGKYMSEQWTLRR